MAKDAYWFKHDSTSGRGLRLRKIQALYGHWGKGVYWDVIEVLREQDKYAYECDEQSIKMLAGIIGVEPDKFFEWYNKCVSIELFLEEKGKFYSEILCENMAKWEVKKSNGKSPKKKRNKSESKANSLAKQEHKIIEEDIIEELLLQQRWCDEVCIKHGLDLESLRIWLVKFHAHTITIGEKHSEEGKYKYHFSMWMGKQPKNKGTVLQATI